MAKADDGSLERHQKVVAAADLPGVPAGTPGKVILVNGFSWIRYRVAFENGRGIGSARPRRAGHPRGVGPARGRATS
ncbi:MAG: hypothetical protein U5R31_07950 [Acidimicrobiia bacterium]|nr:hypothetical protein [Acidimicrobiia bacterium]